MGVTPTWFPTDNLGEDEEWFLASYNDREWDLIPVGVSWRDSCYDCEGVAWSRLEFDCPTVPDKRDMFLYFGAVDGDAKVYLNGEEMGSHDSKRDGWDQRFGFRLGQVLREGQNVIAVREEGGHRGGGIWRPVRLIVERKAD